MKKHLFWLGLTLWIAGIVAWLITGNLSPVPLALIFSGIALIISRFAVKDKGFWSRRSTQTGTNALIATLAVLAIMALINFIAVRHGVPLDLTENKLFTLSPQTQEIVENLSEPLQIWVFQREPNQSAPRSGSLRDRQLLNNYSRYSPNFQYQFVDPDVDIAKAQAFGITTEEAAYLEYGEKRQLVQTLNRGESLSEIQLTNAILKIQQDRPLEVYFLQGHGEIPLEGTERSLKEAVTSLEQQGYTVAPLNLATGGQIPENTNAVIVPGPERPLFPEEVEVLQQYLEGGGGLLLMVDPKINSGLAPLLSEWGVELDERIAIDESALASLPPRNPLETLVNSYGNHPITQDFGNGYSLYPFTRPLQIQEESGIEAVELILSNEFTWAKQNLESQELQFNPEEDLRGPLYFGIALESEEGRMVVFGSSTFATNGLFSQPQLLNGDMFLNAINWLGRRDLPVLSIRPQEQQNRRINLTPIQGAILSWSALRIVPLLGLITAAMAWYRRR